MIIMKIIKKMMTKKLATKKLKNGPQKKTDENK